MALWVGRPLLVNRMTDVCKTITFLQLRLGAVKIKKLIHLSSECSPEYKYINS